jgi:hypothetical protein
VLHADEVDVERGHHMKFLIGISTLAFAMGSACSALAFPHTDLSSLSRPATEIIKADDTLSTLAMNLRSVSFIAAKLIERGFVIADARRQGQIYIFSTSKNGYVQYISVDARDARIVGLKVLSAPAGVELRAPESSGNRFIDESYEFGYAVTEAEYQGLKAFTSTELASTAIYTITELTDADVLIYEPLDDVADGSDDLDKGEVGDAEGNVLVDSAVPAEPSAEDQVGDCPPGGDGTDACPPEPGDDAVPPEPGDDEPVPDEPSAVNPPPQ